MRPTSVLYGADWGASDAAKTAGEDATQKLEDEFDAFTISKSDELAKPLVEAGISVQIKIVKDHDMKERLCLEVGCLFSLVLFFPFCLVNLGALLAGRKAWSQCVYNGKQGIWG